MTTITATSPATPSSTSSSIWLTAIAALLLAGFGAFSLWVVASHGYFGFLALAGREPWALQMLLDLAIALGFAIGWMRRDSRARGIAIWPYVIATVLLGSIGVLAYCVRRAVPAR